MRAYILVISILVLALIYFTFFQQRQYTETETIDLIRSDIRETEKPNPDLPHSVQENTQPYETSPVMWVPKQDELPPDSRSSLLEDEMKVETDIVCPDDVFVCSSGGFGEPNYSIELKRVPPSCEFPACPG